MLKNEWNNKKIVFDLRDAKLIQNLQVDGYIGYYDFIA